MNSSESIGAGPPVAEKGNLGYSILLCPVLFQAICRPVELNPACWL